MKKYRYIKIGREYYRLRQNPLLLAWFLYLSGSSFQLRFGRTKNRMIKCVIGLMLHQIHLRKRPDEIDIPCAGNLCLRVHRGFKAFDLGRKTVRRIFDREIDAPTALKEINGVKMAANLEFAPNVSRWNIEEKWYEEEFISGEPCYASDSPEELDTLELFQSEIAPCLEQMIVSQPPVIANFRQYVNKLISIVEEILSRTAPASDEIDLIRIHLGKTASSLLDKQIERLDLFFSHGDYSLVNILRTRNGTKAIDWEGAAFRNPLYDLYNFFFTELYYKRAKTNLVVEINEAVLTMQARLYSKLPGIAKSIEVLASTYRRLYYIERVCMLLERELSNQLLNVVLRSIDVFERYENVVEGRNPS